MTEASKGTIPGRGLLLQRGRSIKRKNYRRDTPQLNLVHDPVPDQIPNIFGQGLPQVIVRLTDEPVLETGVVGGQIGLK